MDPRRRADEALARASDRGAFVITPDNATSPMDASATVRIPRDMLPGARQDGDPATAPQQTQQHPIGWPQHESGHVQQHPTPQVQQTQNHQPPGHQTQSHQIQGHQTKGHQTPVQSPQQYPRPRY